MSKRSADLGGLMPTFITVAEHTGRPYTYGPFWSRRRLRSALNELEEIALGRRAAVVEAEWRPPRSISRWIRDVVERRTVRP